MISLAATGTLAAQAGANTTVTMTVFGDEITGGTDVFKKLYQGQPSTSAATVYTVPASTATLIKTIMLLNTSASPVTLALFIDGTAAAQKILDTTIPANGLATYDSDGWKTFSSTGALQTSGGSGSTNKYSALIGDGSTTTFNLTHGLGNQNIAGLVITRVSDGELVDADIVIPPAGTTIQVTFASAPATNSYRVTAVA